MHADACGIKVACPQQFIWRNMSKSRVIALASVLVAFCVVILLPWQDNKPQAQNVAATPHNQKTLLTEPSAPRVASTESRDLLGNAIDVVSPLGEPLVNAMAIMTSDSSRVVITTGAIATADQNGTIVIGNHAEPDSYGAADITIACPCYMSVNIGRLSAQPKRQSCVLQPLVAAEVFVTDGVRGIGGVNVAVSRLEADSTLVDSVLPGSNARSAIYTAVTNKDGHAHLHVDAFGPFWVYASKAGYVCARGNPCWSNIVAAGTVIEMRVAKVMLLQVQDDQVLSYMARYPTWIDLPSTAAPSLQKLSEKLAAKFPNSMCLAGLPKANSVEDTSTGVPVQLFLSQRGAVVVDGSFRDYSDDMQPEQLVTSGALIKGAEVTLEAGVPDDAVAQCMTGLPLLVVPLDSDGHPVLGPMIGIQWKSGATFMLPQGRYQITSLDPLVRDNLMEESGALRINGSEPVILRCRLKERVHEVRLRASLDGVAVQRCRVALRNLESNRRTTEGVLDLA